jgi:hypothetical protein
MPGTSIDQLLSGPWPTWKRSKNVAPQPLRHGGQTMVDELETLSC